MNTFLLRLEDKNDSNIVYCITANRSVLVNDNYKNAMWILQRKLQEKDIAKSVAPPALRGPYRGRSVLRLAPGVRLCLIPTNFAGATHPNNPAFKRN